MPDKILLTTDRVVGPSKDCVIAIQAVSIESEQSRNGIVAVFVLAQCRRFSRSVNFHKFLVPYGKPSTGLVECQSSENIPGFATPVCFLKRGG